MNSEKEIPSVLLEKGRKRLFTMDDNIFRMNGQVTHCYFILTGITEGILYKDHGKGYHITDINKLKEIRDK